MVVDAPMDDAGDELTLAAENVGGPSVDFSPRFGYFRTVGTRASAEGCSIIAKQS